MNLNKDIVANWKVGYNSLIAKLRIYRQSQVAVNGVNSNRVMALNENIKSQNEVKHGKSCNINRQQ